MQAGVTQPLMSHHIADIASLGPTIGFTPAGGAAGRFADLVQLSRIIAALRHQTLQYQSLRHVAITHEVIRAPLVPPSGVIIRGITDNFGHLKACHHYRLLSVFHFELASFLRLSASWLRVTAPRMSLFFFICMALLTSLA